ncbi:MAG: SGNH/GDSL hydrolase family protein [Verrucomicrobiota bacterium]
MVPFSDRSRHAFVGDSITHVGLYGCYVELFYQTRYPAATREFLNLGIAGDTASGGLQRSAWDLFPAQPNSASLLFGMNDVDRDLYKTDSAGSDLAESRRRRIADYEESTGEFIKKLQAANMQVILVTPSIYDETAVVDAPNLPGVNRIALNECARVVLDLGRQFGLPVVDFFHPMMEINLRQQKEDAGFTLIGPDRVHPGAPGHLVMAWLFLRAQNVTPTISRISLNATTGKMEESANCTVDELQANRNGVRFRYHARALPFPIDDPAKSALAWGSIMEDLNQEILRVVGLEPGSYRLRIDADEIRTFAAEELSAGVNLAAGEPTPQYRQAQKVLHLAQERWATVVTLRDILFVENGTMGANTPRPLSFEQVEPRLEERIREITGGPSEPYHRQMIKNYVVNKPQETEFVRKAAELRDAIRQASQPISRLFELIPA